MKRRVSSSAEMVPLWQGRVDAWRQSGLSQKEFCKRNHLGLSTFSRWFQRLKAQVVQVPTLLEIVPLPRIQVPPVHHQGPPVVVVVGGGRYRLEVSDGFQAETLQTVLQVVEGRA